jgi:hypothetical protein
MKNTTLFVLTIALAMVLGMAAVGSANAPPWPVNQKAYIPDGVFNKLAEPDCRACHEDPDIAVNGANIPNRHHNLVQNPAETINCDYTAAVFAGCDAANGKMYECLDCHGQVWNSGTLSYDFETFRDCLFCHEQLAGQASVHHLTEPAQTSNCKACHAPIDNPWAWEDTNGVPRHYIPTYAASLVTPDKALGTGTDNRVTPTGHAGQGGCAFCHGPLMGDPALTDSETGILVYDNGATHHSTGITIGPFDPLTPAETRPSCLMCHNLADTPYINIRGCEQCHSVKTLHNIQVDSNGGGIVPGQELAYWGHIGANADCNGCHLNSAVSAAAPYSGPVIPNVSGISRCTVTAGVDTLVKVTGSAFTNKVLQPSSNRLIVKTSNCVLTAADGSTVTLAPSEVTESLMVVTLPATLAPGNYELRAVKGPSASGPVVVAVVPAVTIDSATCSDGIVDISGTGFSQHMDATNSGTGVQIVGGGTCSVDSWNDTGIEADCGTCSGAVEVSSVFGTASQIIVSLDPVNESPVANVGPDTFTTVKRSVRFNGNASMDPDGKIASYQWDFGDGTRSGSGSVVYHRFTKRGTFTVTLTVTDKKGATGVDTAIVRVR